MKTPDGQTHGLRGAESGFRAVRGFKQGIHWKSSISIGIGDCRRVCVGALCDKVESCAGGEEIHFIACAGAGQHEQLVGATEGAQGEEKTRFVIITVASAAIGSAGREGESSSRSCIRKLRNKRIKKEIKIFIGEPPDTRKGSK